MTMQIASGDLESLEMHRWTAAVRDSDQLQPDICRLSCGRS